MVHEDLVSAPTTGINFYQSTTDFDVNKGDVIGVIQLSGALYQQTMSSGSCYELAVTTGHTGGGSLTLTNAMTCLDGQHQFLAHMIKVSCIFFQYIDAPSTALVLVLWRCEARWMALLQLDLFRV